MRRIPLVIALLLVALALPAQSLRGPLTEVVVTPTDAAEATALGLESIVLVRIDGDPRFLDAIDIEIDAPRAVADVPGAVQLIALAPVRVQLQSGIADVVGEELLQRPFQRAGKSFYQVVIADDTSPDASPIVTRIGDVVPTTAFPLVLSFVSRMKVLTDALNAAEFTVSVRPVTRNIGAAAIRYVREDGTTYDATSARAPEFRLEIDDLPADIANEYLLAPGLHRLKLISDRYQDQEVTVGIEQGRKVELDLPLTLALATVNYTAPRGSSVYVDGRALDGARGDFTVPPGEHTIVVVLGDYTVTRRFVAEEQRTYTISVTMGIVVEEIK